MMVQLVGTRPLVKHYFLSAEKGFFAWVMLFFALVTAFLFLVICSFLLTVIALTLVILLLLCQDLR